MHRVAKQAPLGGGWIFFSAQSKHSGGKLREHAKTGLFCFIMIISRACAMDWSRGEPAGLAAAAALLLRTAPASDLPPTLAVDVPTRSSRFACVHGSMRHKVLPEQLAHGVLPPNGKAARAQRA